jgi:hypothetical protein
VAAGDPGGEDKVSTAAPTPHATSTANATSSHRVRDRSMSEAYCVNV